MYIEYGDFYIHCQDLLPNTCMCFIDTQNTYTYFENAKCMFWDGMGGDKGKEFGPNILVDFTEPVSKYNKRNVLILSGGTSYCFVPRHNNKLKMELVDCNGQCTLQSNTMALVMQGNVNFIEDCKNKNAERHNLIIRRPNEIQLYGQARLILVTV